MKNPEEIHGDSFNKPSSFKFKVATRSLERTGGWCVGVLVYEQMTKDAQDGSNPTLECRDNETDVNYHCRYSRLKSYVKRKQMTIHNPAVIGFKKIEGELRQKFGDDYPIVNSHYKPMFGNTPYFFLKSDQTERHER